MALYVVTGGAGFIGSHLVDALLAAGHAVRVVDDLSTGCRANLDARADLIVGDVAEPGLMPDVLAGAAGCFHLAAVASVIRGNEDWLGTHRSNQTGTIAVLDAARQEGARQQGGVPVVYASSAAVYGDQGDAPITEDARLRPRSAYGADKLGCELHAAVAFGVHGVPTLGLRFFNVYGPRQEPTSPYSGVISIFAARIAGGRDVTVHGSGQQTRDFVYVGDVVRHLLAGMTRLHTTPEADVLNVCTGRGTSLLDLVDTLGAVTGRDAKVQFGPARAGDIRTSVGDPARACAALRVRAATTLLEGLGRMLDREDAPARSMVPA